MSDDAYKVYTKVLKKGMNIGIRRIFETFVFAISIFAISMIYFYFLLYADLSATAKIIFFPIGIIYEIILILSYIENHYQFEIFSVQITKFFSYLGIFSILISILFSAISAFYTNTTYRWLNTSLVLLFFLLTTIESGYFIFSVPRTEYSSSYGLEDKFKVLDNRLKSRKLSDLELEQAIEKGINNLKSRISNELMWGDLNPVYDTACVLDLFYSLGMDLNTKWTIQTEDGNKVIKLKNVFDNLHTLANTYDTLEMTYEQFFVLNALSLYDPTIFDDKTAEINAFLEKMKNETEWDFISRLNQFTPNVRYRSTPVELIMGPVADNTGNIQLLEQLAQLFTSSIDIIVRRGYSRFSASKTGKTPVEMFARLMLALHEMRRMPPTRPKFVQSITNSQYMEGSWASNVGTTGYVIQSLIPCEVTESLSLKKAGLYLTATQDNKGIWRGNIEETTIAIKALFKLTKMAEQEEI